MPRATWSGAISFGMVTIPVKLYPAVSRRTVQFHQYDAETGSRIRIRKVSAETGEEVPADRIVKGHEIAGDQHVVIDDAELAALEPGRTHSISVEAFVELGEIDPVHFDTPYLVAPAEGGANPYALLVAVMEQRGKAAIGRFVMRTREYLVALRSSGGHLLLNTLAWADELVDPADIGGLDGAASVEVDERELEVAGVLVDALSGPFDAATYEDTYRKAVLDLIERKAAGEVVVTSQPAERRADVVDLLAALEASVEAAKDARTRHPASREVPSDRPGVAGGGDAPGRSQTA